MLIGFDEYCVMKNIVSFIEIELKEIRSLIEVHALGVANNLGKLDVSMNCKALMQNVFDFEFSLDRLIVLNMAPRCIACELSSK
uniref:Uncharacterized protein n=1 Tax=Strigamia maritima TaxID=126957 RepID=T1JAA7_STRMM